MTLLTRVRAGIVVSLMLASVASASALPLARGLTAFAREAWQSDQGLPSGSINALAQTRDGYLWIGTDTGLVRFDGARFVVFNRRNTAALEDHHVQALHASADGTLWIGTRAGGLVSLTAGTFTRFTSAQGLGGDRILAITSDRDGVVWIGTNGGGLSRLMSGVFTTLTTRDGLSDNRVAHIVHDAKGDLWIATLGGGLARLSGGRVSPVDDDLVRRQSIAAMAPARDGSVWLGTDRGLLRSVGDRLERYAPAAGLESTGVLSLLEDRDGTLWIGTNGKGLRAIRQGRLDALAAPDLTSNVISAIVEDREGSVWLGTAGGGLNRLRDTPFTAVTARDGLGQDTALAVFEDRDGVLWIGTSGGGISTLRDGIVAPFPAGEALAHSVVFSIAEDDRGSLWIGTGDAGVYRLDRRGRVATRVSGLPDEAAYVILAVPGQVWIGTGHGLIRMHDGDITTFTTRDGLSNDDVRALAADPDGSLWVGTNGGGLIRFHDGAFSAPIKTTGPGAFIRAIHRDASGPLWIGTSGGGLLRAPASQWGRGDNQSSTTAALSMRDGLADDVVLQILDDHGGNLWLSSMRGISRIAKADVDAYVRGATRSLNVATYGRGDGMPSVECSGGFQPAGWRGRDGRLWFPTRRGVTGIDPARLTESHAPASVIVEEALIDGQPVDPRTDVRFPAGGGQLEFRYTALSLVDPLRVRFRYQLEGFDRDWVEAGTRRVAYYTNMPSGRYTFRVAASAANGPWGDNAARFSFVLAPHFYRTNWFFALCLVALIGTASGAYWLRLKRAAGLETELRRLVEERTRQLQQANDHLQRLSYMDALTNIPNRRHFEEILDIEWRRSFRAKTPIALLMLDIDHFKIFNDTFGHRAGDGCLTRVAAVLDDSVKRAGDMVARYGGEEFAAILTNTDLDGASGVAERLRAAVEALGIAQGGSDPKRVVTISVGIASAVPGDVVSQEALLAAADTALYDAKRAGRNCVRIAPRRTSVL